MNGQISLLAALGFVLILLIAGGAYLSLCFALGALMNKLHWFLQRRFFLRTRTNKIVTVWFTAQAILGLAWILHAATAGGGKVEVLVSVFAILAFVCVTGIFGALAFGTGIS